MKESANRILTAQNFRILKWFHVEGESLAFASCDRDGDVYLAECGIQDGKCFVIMHRPFQSWTGEVVK